MDLTEEIDQVAGRAEDFYPPSVEEEKKEELPKGVVKKEGKVVILEGYRIV